MFLCALAVFDGTPRTRIDIRAATGAMDGEAATKGAYYSACIHYIMHGTCMYILW